MYNKRLLRIAFAVLTVLFLITAQTSCSGTTKQEAAGKSLSEKVVGFSIYATNDDYTSSVVDAFSNAMDQVGIKYKIKDANGDVKKQISDVENLVAENVDMIAILPLDERAIRNSLNEASDKNIPVVSITQIPWVDVAVTISGGDYINGKGAAKALREKLNGKGKVLVLDYSSDLARVAERMNGFSDEMKDSEIKVIGTLRTANTEETMEAVKEQLEVQPDINGIFALDSNQVIGCGAALKALDRKDIIVTGIGSEMNTIDMILDGYITAVAARFPNEHGRLMADAIHKFLKGEKYEKNYDASFKIIDKFNAVEMAKVLYNKNIK